MDASGQAGHSELDEARFRVHTPDSWARAVMSAVVEEAGRSAQESGSARVDCTLELQRIGPAGAAESDPHHTLGICADIGGHHYCIGLYVSATP